MRTLLEYSLGLFAFILCGCTICRADMGLLVEDPAGYKGFWSDSGHLAIWIDGACVGTGGVVTQCVGGSGVVLSSTSYWSNSGWAAIPAALYLEGLHGESDATSWTSMLGDTYPDIPINYGRKYIGRLNHRGTYVLRIRTSAAQDSLVLERIQQQRSRFRYTVFSSNCSDFAREVLDLYFPGHFSRHWMRDFGISTPHGVAIRFWRLGQQEPGLEMRVFYLARRTRPAHLHDGRTKGICEAAVTDVKYALPLVFYQPVIYAAFSVCYLAIDQPAFLRRGFRHDAQPIGSLEQLNLAFEATPRPEFGPRGEDFRSLLALPVEPPIDSEYEQFGKGEKPVTHW